MDTLLRILGLFMLVIIIMFMIYLLYKAGNWFKRTSERLQLMEHWTEQHDKSYETKHIYSYIQKGQERHEGMIKELARQMEQVEYKIKVQDSVNDNFDQSFRLQIKALKTISAQFGKLHMRINKEVQKADHKLNPNSDVVNPVDPERTSKDPIYVLYETDLKKVLDEANIDYSEDEFIYLVNFTVRHFNKLEDLYHFARYHLESYRKKGPNTL